MHRLIGVFGLLVMLGLAWLMSSHKRKVNVRIVVGGLLLQFLFFDKLVQIPDLLLVHHPVVVLSLRKIYCFYPPLGHLDISLHHHHGLREMRMAMMGLTELMEQQDLQAVMELMEIMQCFVAFMVKPTTVLQK